MLAFAADEGFRIAIVDGLRRRIPGIDIATIQEADLSGSRDRDVLEWAAGGGRILLTHDLKTMEGFAYERVENGFPMPGVFIVRWTFPIGDAIDEIALAVEYGSEEEWRNRVVHLPFR